MKAHQQVPALQLGCDVQVELGIVQRLGRFVFVDLAEEVDLGVDESRRSIHALGSFPFLLRELLIRFDGFWLVLLQSIAEACQSSDEGLFLKTAAVGVGDSAVEMDVRGELGDTEGRELEGDWTSLLRSSKLVGRQAASCELGGGEDVLRRSPCLAVGELGVDLEEKNTSWRFSLLASKREILPLTSWSRTRELDARRCSCTAIPIGQSKVYTKSLFS